MTIPGWEDRDLVVLRAVVEYCETHAGYAEVHHIRSRVDLPERQIRKAFTALSHESPKLFGNFWHGGAGTEVHRLELPTGEARRRLGLWPKPEVRIEQMIKVLEALAERTSDPDEKAALTKSVRSVRAGLRASRDFLIGVASSAAVSGVVGGG